MKNTLENKAKFFTQYFGQKVRVWKKDLQTLLNISYASLSIEAVEDSYLELKPLSQISDEDAIWLANWGYGCYNISDEEKILRVKKDKYKYYKGCFTNVYVVDYFRSKGYALPWNGITVEEQIKFGWIKLKK